MKKWIDAFFAEDSVGDHLCVYDVDDFKDVVAVGFEVNENEKVWLHAERVPELIKWLQEWMEFHASKTKRDATS